MYNNTPNYYNILNKKVIEIYDLTACRKTRNSD